MKTIVVPVDFTPVSLNAANYAADMACVIGCSISLLHIYPLPVIVGDTPAIIYGPDETESFETERLTKLRSDILDRTKDRIKVSVKVVQGDVLPAIENFCKHTNPYAVVMGRETADKLSRFFGIAPVTGGLRQLEWPLLAVPENARFSSIKKIGLACDFVSVPETIPFLQIKNIVKELKAELHVIHISETSAEVFNPDIIEESDWLRAMLKELNPVYHLINSSDIEKGIEEFAETNKLDMLIIIPKNHTLLHRLFKKSISKQLVIHSHLPILALHE